MVLFKNKLISFNKFKRDLFKGISRDVSFPSVSATRERAVHARPLRAAAAGAARGSLRLHGASTSFHHI